MARRQFEIPPVLPLIGSKMGNFVRIIRNGKIERRYYGKVALTGLIILLATPFHMLDSWYFKGRIKKYRFGKPPLFIIGHWRSGTTLLHNCLCQDRTAAYLTTYHSLFPNNLRSKLIFKTFSRIGMPEKRPSDNMELNVSYPQEEEFALGNLHANFYYRFFYFPGEYRKYYEESAHLDVTGARKEAWKKAYVRLLKKAALNTGGERLIVKNPVNTARIRTILEIFPDAKFLFIYRNPVSVFLSTQRFFQSLFPSIWLHSVDREYINHMILDVYIKMMKDYTEGKQLIPAGNLMELRFEDFESRPIACLRSIYTKLLKEDFETIRNKMVQYLKSIRNYRKNDYATNKRTVESVASRWHTYMEKWKYRMPENIVVSK